MSTRPSAWSSTRPQANAEFATDVEYYLSQDPRQLPSRYLYDPLGSALFDAICELPWYRITRAELTLLEQHGARIFAHAGPPSRIVELGPGNGSKLLTLVQNAREKGAAKAGRRLQIHLVDVSAAALARAADTLGELEDVDIAAHADTYESGLASAMHAGSDRGATLVLFLGSNIGNFDPPGAAALLASIRSALGAHDGLLLGADLVKAEGELQLAYDDPLGVTAAFNKNLLVRINRELGGDFDIEAFDHRAQWNGPESRVEMHLVSRQSQHVSVKGANLEFDMRKGETIWTESSYKYEPEGVTRLLAQAGFRTVEQWVAREERFLLTLARAR